MCVRFSTIPVFLMLIYHSELTKLHYEIVEDLSMEFTVCSKKSQNCSYVMMIVVVISQAAFMCTLFFWSYTKGA